MCGARIGFYRGDIKLLIEDIQALKPTIFISVPRLLNRVYDKVCELFLTGGCETEASAAFRIPLYQVLAGVATSPVKKWLFEKAMAWKLSEVRRWVTR